MKINNFLVTGDTHGRTIERLDYIRENMPEYIPEETAVIILGDAAFNFRLNSKDNDIKSRCNNSGYLIYCVRGNHEQRPELIDTMTKVFDAIVGGYIYYEPQFPYIRYFVDGGEYNIGGHSSLVIGGAYSIDKWYRLARAGYKPEEASIADPKACGWFKDEQLSAQEREDIWNKVQGKHYDFVFTHTAPIDWEPTDLFLGFVDQSTVDKTMEYWLSDLKETFSWGVWCFGHYHTDRIERHNVQQMYMSCESLDTIWNRWHNE